MKKFTKKETRYTDDHGTSNEQCSKCEYYVSATVCEIVEGKIKPGGWCNKYKKSASIAREERLEGQQL